MKNRFFLFLCTVFLFSVQSWGQIWNLTPTMTATLDASGVLTIATTKSEGEAMPDFWRTYTGMAPPTSTSPWFSLRSTISSIVIEDKVTSIGNSAFLYCDATITIPNSVTTIGDYAFESSFGLTSIPNSVTSIGSGAFSGCYSLTSIPSSIATIPSYAFAYCHGLISISIPASVTTIGYDAFRACIGLKDVTVQWQTPLTVSDDIFNIVELSNLTLIVPAGTKALYEEADVWQDFGTIEEMEPIACTPIASGVFGDADALNWSLCNDGTLTISGEGAMPNYEYETLSLRPWDAYQEQLKALVIEEGITSIGDWAFHLCSGLTGNFVIPNSVTTIGESAFSRCRGLTGLTLGNSVTSIGGFAFNGCDGLTGQLVIPNSVTSIGNAAFQLCIGLTGNLVIPNSVTTIEDHTFSNCSGLSGNLVIPNSVTSIGSAAFQKCDFTGLTLGNSLTSIGQFAFAECRSLTGDLVIPNSVTTIEGWAFNETGITGLTFGNSLTSIEEGVFYGCVDLTGELNISNSVTSIGNYAFYGCRGLTGNLFIPNSVTSIGANAFWGCVNLQSVTVQWATPLTVPNTIFSNVPISELILTVPAGTQALYQADPVWGTFGTIVEAGGGACDNPIASGSFGENDALSWTLCPDGTLTISGVGAMPNYEYGTLSLRPWDAYQEQLKTLVIEEGITSIGAFSFAGCSGFTGNLIIPNSIVSIGAFAFFFCSGFTGDLIIPNSVTSIEDAAFQWCAGLTGELVISNSVTSIGNTAFYNCSGLTGNLIIPNSITSIEYGTFYNCSGFTGNLIIPNSVTSIDNTAFQWCTGLTGELVIPNSVTSIGYEAFLGCSGFAGNLIIPNSVTSIGNSAFGDCVNLQSVSVQWATPLTVPNTVFSNVPISDLILTVPAGTQALYQADPVWGTFGTIVEQEAKPEVGLEEESPVGDDGTGKMALSLLVPASTLFSGSFRLELPNGMHLDVSQTRLAADLASQLMLGIVQNADGSWLFTITPLNLRSATDLVYSRIVEMVYTVDETVTEGTHEARISDLLFEFDDGSRIVEASLPVTITVNPSTGILGLGAETFAYLSKDRLYVQSPAAETVRVYAASGRLLYSFQKPAGKASYSIDRSTGAVWIVKGSSGWVKKVIMN